MEYCRETARHARDALDLALPGRDKKEVTRLIYERIAGTVELDSGDDLADIGCGDGTLLRIAERVGTGTAVGLRGNMIIRIPATTTCFEKQGRVVLRIGTKSLERVSNGQMLTDDLTALQIF